MNRSWVRFPQAAQIRPPGSGWAFFMRACCLWSHGCCGRRRARLWGRAARCARGRRPVRWCSGRRVACLDGPGCSMCPWAAARPRDRHTRACGSEWSISRPALALPPPTGTAARPRVLQLARALWSLRRPPHQWGWVADVCSARRLVVRPGPAAQRRGQAVQSPPVSPASQYLPHRQRWGFCSIRRWLAACRRHVAPLMTLFPRLVAEPCDYADCDGRRVAPSCSCRCQGPNAGPQPYEATVASGKIG